MSPVPAQHAVDNVGTCALIDAAKAAGVRKVVLVSSILTDGGAWGQLNSPGYQIVRHTLWRASQAPNRSHGVNSPGVSDSRPPIDSHTATSDKRLRTRARGEAGGREVPARLRARLDDCEARWTQGGPAYRRALRLGREHAQQRTCLKDISDSSTVKHCGQVSFSLYT